MLSIPKNTVFTRYNQALLAAYLLFLVAATMLIIYLYLQTIKEAEQHQQIELANQASTLNVHMQNNLQSLKAMQAFANDFMNSNKNSNYAFPNLIQDKQRFYLGIARQDVINRSKTVKWQYNRDWQYRQLF